MRGALLLGSMFLVAGCGQEIVVVDCDAHDVVERDGGTEPPRDGGDVTPRDGGDVTPRDGGDVTPRDGGEISGCPGGSPYCITSLTVSAARTTPRAPVTLTAVVDNPDGMALTFAVDPAEIVASRRAGFVPFDDTYVPMTYALNGDGVATFTVNDVPTWFVTTTFTLRMTAQAPGGPEVWAEADVVVEGNVVWAASPEVYATAADGRPATSVNFTSGRLLSGDSFVRRPEDVLVARDGTLLVLDLGTDPQRIKRFELSGENVQLGEFETDEAGTPFLDADTSYGMAQLDDGRVVVIDQALSRAPPVKFLLYGEDGTYLRALVPTNPTARYRGVAAGPDGSFVATERSPGERIVRFDPDTGAELGDVATQISQLAGITRSLEGDYYVGTEGVIIRITSAGARSMVNNVPGSTFDDWNYLSPFGPGRVLGSAAVSSGYQNIAVIEGTQSLGWFRLDGVSNPVRTPRGIAHLD